jgi:acetoacetyl-CoA synthetase
VSPVSQLWQVPPESIARSQLTHFARFCAAETGEALADWPALYQFSVTHFRRFWALFVRWSGALVDGEAEPVCVGDRCEEARFFPGLRLNYVENLLGSHVADDARPALTLCSEAGVAKRLDRGELRRAVVRTALKLRELGVGPGDRIGAIINNNLEGVIACLASTALGASWSAVGADLGAFATLNRFRALEPTWLIVQPSAGTQAMIAEVAAGLPTARGFVSLYGDGDGSSDLLPELALPSHRLDTSAPGEAPPFEWPRLPFNHPLFILFSSGTTGTPKCIMHGAGGTLMEHLKELRLHCDLSSQDRLFFQTSPAWMMWNWQLSALGCGSEIILYPGSVGFPDALWRVVAASSATVFGTSPGYLRYCESAGFRPRDAVALPSLRAMLSTGSILFDRQYDWVRDAVKEVPLQSISGGTDIIGCFVLGNPNLPVYRGESQSVSLGLDVRAMPADGGAPARPGTGELVCVNPFPSRPIGFYGDPDGRRFHDAYFSQNPGVWTHGDFIELTERGTARINGRSDGVLNIRGVRIGPAEIYHILQEVPEIEEALAVEQASTRVAGESRLVLLAVLHKSATLDQALTLRIKKTLKQRGSLLHVPAVIAAVDELPTTHTGKRSERAVTDALNGRSVRNRGALKNPDALDAILRHPALAAAY